MSEDDTFRVLRRTPATDINKMILDNMHRTGNDSSNRYVLEELLISNGWTLHEYNTHPDGRWLI